MLNWNWKEEVSATSKQAFTAPDIPETTYYQYDSKGKRLRKITENFAASPGTPTQKNQRIYIEGWEFYEDFSSTYTTETLSLIDGGQRFVMIEQSTDPAIEPLLTRYIHPNHQGSCTLETDENGDIITYEEYHPFGTTSYQATNQTIQAPAKRYRYTGMERDDETGLNYHNARYYIPWLGRWLNPDPIGIGDGVNVYVYCGNDPVNNTDVNGTQQNLGSAGTVTFNPGSDLMYINPGTKLQKTAVQAETSTNAPMLSAPTTGAGTNITPKEGISASGSTRQRTSLSEGVGKNQSVVKYILGGYAHPTINKAKNSYQDNIKSAAPINIKPQSRQSTPQSGYAEIGPAPKMTEYEQKQQKMYNEEVEGSTFRGAFVKYSNKIYNPIRWGMDLYSFGVSNPGFDSRGRSMTEGQAQEKLIGLGFAAAPIFGKLASSSNLWRVGTYNELRGLEFGLDAHHVGQKALMAKLVPGYNPATAPSILVPKLGHTQGAGVLSRSSSGITNARQLLARDILELRRVYGSQGIPNSSLQELIQLNKTMYPNAFTKVKLSP